VYIYIYINYTYLYISANNGSEKKNTATSGKLIIAVYASYIYVCCFLHKLVRSAEYISLFIGLGGWGVRGKERKIWQ
jgi:hypothetical protein